MSLEDEVPETLDRGKVFAERRAQASWQAHMQLSEDERVRERVLDEQRLQTQSELVAILRKYKVATVAIYRGEGLFAAKVDGWIISGYQPGRKASSGQLGDVTEPEVFGVALGDDGVCYAYRRSRKPRRRGGYVYGRRLMMGPVRPLRQHTQQEIAVRAKCGTFEIHEWDGGET